MTLRFRDRHLHKSIFEALKADLIALGWTTTTPIFSASPVRYLAFQPDENGVAITPNVISVSMGVPGLRKAAEMGDGLFTYSVPIFVDIYGEKAEISESIGCDVMDVLRKYHDRSFIQDYTDPAHPSASSDTWEVENEQGPLLTTAAAEAKDFRKFWRVCRFEACVYYL